MVSGEWTLQPFTIHHFTIHRNPSGTSDFPSVLGGFPHSEIVGSKGIRTSPTLIAAYHVLHRLCMPRHPPVALKTLDHSHCQCPSRLAPDRYRQKDQLLEICPVAAVKRPIIWQDLSTPADTPPIGRCPNKSSLHDVIQNRRSGHADRKPLSRADARSRSNQALVEPDGIEPTTPCLQSRCSPS